MGLLDDARRDLYDITSDDDEFGCIITITFPTSEVVEIKGLHSKHHFAINPQGNPVNSKNSHISFSEQAITDQGYSIRNNKGEVYLKNFLVKVKDSTGLEKDYKIREWLPDETLGLITCFLGDYE